MPEDGPVVVVTKGQVAAIGERRIVFIYKLFEKGDGTLARLFARRPIRAPLHEAQVVETNRKVVTQAWLLRRIGGQPLPSPR